MDKVDKINEIKREVDFLTTEENEDKVWDVINKLSELQDML